MSLLGKIQALFADKERTQAIFPLTKVKAISDDDGTGLDAILDRAVYTDDGVIETSVASRDADTLGGLPAATYATTSFVKNEILNSQVGGDAGEIDLSGLATKDELNSKVNKTGDTMTGDLTINGGDWPSILLKAAGATNAGYLEGSKNSPGSLSLWSQNSADNNATRRGLRLVNSEGNSSIANALILSDLAEGVSRKDYKIYGEHNKPTPADIGAAASSHTHNYAGSSSAGGAATSANKVNKNLVVKLNGGSTEGTNLFTFNGSAAKTVNITPSAIGAAASSHGNHVPTTQTASNKVFLRNDNTWQTVTPSNIGAAASSHNHAAGNITSGTLALARGGTGMTGASSSYLSTNYCTIYFLKFGNLVSCYFLPKVTRNEPIYTYSFTVPSGYRPASAYNVSFYSDLNKAQGSDGAIYISMNTNGAFAISTSYGFTLEEFPKALFWIAA